MRYTKNDIINVFNEWYSIYFNIQKVYVSVSDYATKPEMNYMLKLVVLLEHMETHYEALARKNILNQKVVVRNTLNIYIILLNFLPVSIFMFTIRL